MRKKWLVLLLVGLLIAGLVGTVAAHVGDRPAARAKGQRFSDKGWTEKPGFISWKGLSLTAEQKEKLANLRLEFLEKTLELRTQVAKDRLEIQKLLLEESPNLARVYELVDETSSARAEIQKKAIEFGLEAKDVLTQEQLEKFPGLGLGHGFGGHMLRGMPMVHGGCWR